MAAATYRIGPSDFFLPSDLEADAATLDGQVEQLDAQVEGNEAAPPSFVDQWVAWQGQWKAFYAQHFGGGFVSSLWTAFNDSNRDDLIRYENQLGAFTQQAKGFGAAIIAPVGPSSGSGDTIGKQLAAQASGLPLPSTTTIVVVAVAIIVIFIVWKA